LNRYRLVAKQLDEVSEPVKSYVDEHIEEQVPSHVNPIIAALKEENDNFENDIKRDIGAAFAKMREDMERNEGTLRETNSLAGRNETTVNDLVSSVSQLREDIASKANHLRQEMRNSIASMEKGSQSDISESDLSSALTDIQLDILNFKTETSSKIKGLRDDIARPRTAPAASPANPIVTASALQGFATNEKLKELNGHLQEVESSLRNFATTERLDKLDTHLREVENTATTALAEATAVVDITIKFATDMDGFTSKSRTIEQAMEALRDHVASLREQPSSRPGNAESALTSRFSGSDHDATNIVREDTRAGNEAIESRLQSQERAIKSLTSQYDNITTDYLHQRMSYWIAQNYPDAPDFLNELKRMQVKLELVETFVNDMSWMSADNQQIFGLVRRSDAIQQLLRDKDRLGHTSAWEDFGSIRNRIEMEAQTRTNELEALRDELATERSDRQRLASGLKPVHDAFGKSLPEVELLRNELNNLKPTLELLGTEFDDLKPKVQRLETESGKLEPKVQCLEVNFGKLEPKVEQLETKTNKLDTAKQLSDNSIRELDNQNGRLDKRLELAETRMGKAENSIQEHTQNLSAQGQLIGEYLPFTYPRHVLISLPT
jgi:chromosome segregation ATPase